MKYSRRYSPRSEFLYIQADCLNTERGMFETDMWKVEKNKTDCFCGILYRGIIFNPSEGIIQEDVYVSLASRSKIREFKPGWGRWIFQEVKILSTSPPGGTESEISGSLKNLKPEK